ncbi:MAG: GNAT family protein [Actinomycetota bacterium]|nr:GNAT family protein [Actinomycetota bacterium]
MPTLSTQRLVLRPPQPADAEDALALLQDEQVARWYPAPDVVDLASAAAWCTRGADWSRGDHATWHGVDPVTGRLVVNISLFSIDAEHSTAKVSYRVVPWQRRKGYAREAVLAVTSWAFAERGLARVQLEHSVANTASCGVAFGSGYGLEGTLRSAFVTADGVRQDVHVHGRLATDAPIPWGTSCQ